MGCCIGSCNLIKAGKALAANVSSVDIHHRCVQEDLLPVTHSQIVSVALEQTGSKMSLDASVV